MTYSVNPGQWVMDTSIFDKWHKAGYQDLFKYLAPDGLVVITTRVRDEVLAGRDEGAGVPDPAQVPWVRTVVLNDEEADTEAQIKADIGSRGKRDLGECSVIALCQHRGGVALIDDQNGRDKAQLRGVRVLTSELVLVQAARTIDQVNAVKLNELHDGLRKAGMWLPTHDQGFAAWAMERGWLGPEDLY